MGGRPGWGLKRSLSRTFNKESPVASEPNVDLLMLSALTEEQQVVHAVLQRQARRLGERGDIPNRVMLYDFQDGGETSYQIATACMHDMGVEAMSAFVTGLLSSGLR